MSNVICRLGNIHLSSCIQGITKACRTNAESNGRDLLADVCLKLLDIEIFFLKYFCVLINLFDYDICTARLVADIMTFNLFDIFIFEGISV